MGLEELMHRDGALREATVPVAGLDGWSRALDVVLRLADRWDAVPASQGSPFGTRDLGPWFLADGHARLLRWWVGKTEFHTQFNDPEVFELDFVPTGDPLTTSDVRTMLQALADDMASPVRVRHEFDDLPEISVLPR